MITPEDFRAALYYLEVDIPELAAKTEIEEFKLNALKNNRLELNEIEVSILDNAINHFRVCDLIPYNYKFEVLAGLEFIMFIENRNIRELADFINWSYESTKNLLYQMTKPNLKLVKKIKSFFDNKYSEEAFYNGLALEKDM